MEELAGLIEPWLIPQLPIGPFGLVYVTKNVEFGKA